MRGSGGFTLIEALAATALAVMLMVSVLTVTSSLGRTSAALAAAERSDPAWSDPIAQLLRADLTQARTVQAGSGQVSLTGPLALDSQTLEPTHQEAAVTYQLQAQGKKSYLVRRQVTGLDPATAKAWTELVAWDIGLFQLQALTPTASGGGGQEGNDRFRLTLGLLEPSTPQVQRLIVLR